TADEIAYLCDVANQHFRAALGPADVVWSFAGVRSLYDDGSKKAQDVTRDYVLTLDERDGEAPLLTIYGGTITTYRRLAAHALDRLAHVIAIGPAWTKDSHLPGGEFPYDGVEALVAKTRRSRPFLSEEHALRLVRVYGTRVERVLGPARHLEDLGPCIGADLTAAEVRYLMEREWAQTEDDVLWRRTKLGLRFSSEERRRLANVMAGMVGGRACQMPSLRDADMIRELIVGARAWSSAVMPPQGNELARLSSRNRPGHDLDADYPVRSRADAGRECTAGIYPDLSGARLGRARCRRHLVDDRG